MSGDSGLVRRFELGEVICGLTLQPVKDCPHCIDLALLRPVIERASRRVAAIDPVSGTVTIDDDPGGEP